MKKAATLQASARRSDLSKSIAFLGRLAGEVARPIAILHRSSLEGG
jgi:hypothetical protein